MTIVKSTTSIWRSIFQAALAALVLFITMVAARRLSHSYFAVGPHGPLAMSPLRSIGPFVTCAAVYFILSFLLGLRVRLSSPVAVAIAFISFFVACGFCSDASTIMYEALDGLLAGSVCYLVVHSWFLRGSTRERVIQAVLTLLWLVAGLFLARLAVSHWRSVGVVNAVARLRDEVVELEKRVLPPRLIDRASVENVYGRDFKEWPRIGHRENVTRYQLGTDVTLDICYLDDHVGYADVPVGGLHGMRGDPGHEYVHWQLTRKRELYTQILNTFDAKLPADGMALSPQCCKDLLTYLTDNPTGELWRDIIYSLPESQNTELLPRLIAFPGYTFDNEDAIGRRMWAIIRQQPQTVELLVQALGDKSVADPRKATIDSALRSVSGYFGTYLITTAGPPSRGTVDLGLAASRAKWWQEWWDRHRGTSRVDWLTEPLAIPEYAESACDALGEIDDPRVVPLLVPLLDDASRKTRLCAARALLHQKYMGGPIDTFWQRAFTTNEQAIMAEAQEWVRQRHGSTSRSADCTTRISR